MDELWKSPFQLTKLSRHGNVLELSDGETIVKANIKQISFA